MSCRTKSNYFDKMESPYYSEKLSLTNRALSNHFDTFPAEISETPGLDHFPCLGLENTHFPGLGLGVILDYL